MSKENDCTCTCDADHEKIGELIQELRSLVEKYHGPMSCPDAYQTIVRTCFYDGMASAPDNLFAVALLLDSAVEACMQTVRDDMPEEE